MGLNTEISWCDSTFNPWIGCTKVSLGCANCYAEAQDKFRSWTPNGWGKGKPRNRTSKSNWRQPIKWNREAEVQLLRAGLDKALLPYTRPLVFCASLADWLDNEVPIEWLVDLLKLIHSTPNLNWLLLTKRPENWKHRVEKAVSFVENVSIKANEEPSPFAHFLSRWLVGLHPANIWIGTTVENQEMADKRIPEILKIPAKVRFLSCEPLLGPVDLTSAYLPCPNAEGVIQDPETGAYECCRKCDWTGIGNEMGINWVICGGESGHHARPMNPSWAFSLRDQCNAAGVPFFFKQWGEWVTEDQSPQDIVLPGESRAPWASKDKDGDFTKGDLTNVFKVGKKAAGRELGGRKWNEFPKTDYENPQTTQIPMVG